MSPSRMGRSDVGEGSHWFRGYGLLFRSSIPVPEMLQVDPASLVPGCRPDVRITVGTPPEHLEDPLHVGVHHDANADQFLLRVPDVGRYLVSQDEIVIEPDRRASDHEVRLFLLGTCLGGLLHQRGLLVLHASGIGTDRGAVLFAGVSGAGKSTLLAELMRRGHRMMVDDVCALRVGSDTQPVVVPSYPRTRLWAETADKLSIETAGLPRTRPAMDKFERQLPGQFWDREAPLLAVYHLAGSNGDELSLAALNSIEAFHAVVSNTYRKVLLDSLALRGVHFELASITARTARVVRVIRPVDTFRLKALAELILQDAGIA
jgi:hypothetical protein